MSAYIKTARQISDAVRMREVSAAEIVEAHITRIGEHDTKLNCFTDTTFLRARREAADVDRKIAAGEAAGLLAGVPIAVKNLFDIAGLPTRAGSKIYRDAEPAQFDAPVLGKLIRAGSVLLGGLNMDEFACGFVTENAHDGPTHNPHDLSRIAGGSSGGSAAAVAAGFAPITLGSDTNGSIRVPAGICGVFGFKPAYGRIDRTGTFPFANSFDHLGSFARNVEDLALTYDLMQDTDEISSLLPGEVNPARIAVLDDWFERGAGTEMLDAVKAVADGLGTTTRVTLPEAQRAHAAAACITAFEGGQLHKRNLGIQPENFDPAIRSRLLAGILQPAEAIYQAQRFRAWFRTQAKYLFERFDILLAPATPCTAPLVGQKTMTIADAEVSVRSHLGLYTQPISFIGLPVVCVPAVEAGSLPRGVQIITAPGREALAFAAAFRLERDGIIGATVATL